MKIRTRSVIAVLWTSLFVASCDNVAFIERVRIENDTEYTANIDVRGERDAWLGLTTVDAHNTKELSHVIDQGPSWTFRFKYGPHESLEMTMSKEELIDAGWLVNVPTEFEESLRAEGVPPPP